MDSLHDNRADSREATEDTDLAIEISPPTAPVADERRMQVRAYNYWAALLGKAAFPSADAVLKRPLPDFADHSVLLHFDRGLGDPAIVFLGETLAQECDTQGLPARLTDVPGRSLLSRITDHYLQIIANQAPIGFEAEFVNQRGRTILYRGILLPFSSDDTTIDYIYGVINWKELADQEATDALLLDLGNALEEPSIGRRPAPPLGGWADGPAVLDLGEFALADVDAGQIVPFPGLGTLSEPGIGQPEVVEKARPLSEWLEAARALAAAARSSEDRTRGALYAAISRAWDFALAARSAPDEYARIVAEAGLVMQERAPLIPLVKLVFGADYDKTRLTEYASALGHADRIGLKAGELAGYLAAAPGGLKGVVTLERGLRRADIAPDGADKPAASRGVASLAEPLRRLPIRALSELGGEGAEFALVLVRRLPGGDVALLGDVSDDEALLEKAARRLLD
ncbi:hypothetical protein [Novosphingobium sp. FKTRR1]|uniref:hypothetical protein n=1 Tax=Novosphingobium sp. FKTRR1 TaxID=2879118 RepID=UPI001CF0B6E0|nr:hypothetical protein [Novosphingobium sp. FKTRR1]